MNTKTGIWIDHRKAIVVIISDKGEEIKEIESNVEKQHSRVHGKRSNDKHESQNIAADDVQDRDFAGKLKVFYSEVLACVSEAHSILILGPGEAKGELKKQFEKHNLGNRIVNCVTVDKMTVPQLVEEVREYYQK
jgi:hypothetical protein